MQSSSKIISCVNASKNYTNFKLLGIPETVIFPFPTRDVDHNNGCDPLYTLHPQRRIPCCPLNRMLGRLWIRSGGCELQYKKFLLPGIEQWSPCRPPRTLLHVLTEQRRLPLMKVKVRGILIQKRFKSKYLVFARILCCALWRLFRSTLSRDWRLQHQNKFPGIAMHGDVTGYVESVTNWLKMLVNSCALLLTEGQHITSMLI